MPFVFPCQHDGDQKPLYLFFGEMGYWTIAASVLAAGVHESLASILHDLKIDRSFWTRGESRWRTTQGLMV